MKIRYILSDLDGVIRQLPSERDKTSNLPGIVDERYLKHIETRFKNVPISILTTGTSQLNSDLSKIGLNKRFFKVFNSHEIGISKSDKKIYEFVARDLKCKPSEILFIDDSLSHVQAASEVGLQTHHYKSFEEFLREHPYIG